MQRARDNVALIGMPGAGKSTLGVLLAKRTAREFVDTDLHIQESQGAMLQQIIERHGIDAFHRIEERCVLELDCSHSVIAPGGSLGWDLNAPGETAWGTPQLDSIGLGVGQAPAAFGTGKFLVAVEGTVG